MASTRKFRHQDVSMPGPGTKIRTVRAGAHQIRIAFPKGARKRGVGKIVSILHPAAERNPICDGLTLTEVQSIDIPVSMAASPDLGAAIQEVLESPTETLAANPLDIPTKWNEFRAKLAGWIAPARNPKGKTFKDLSIGTKFEFDRSGPFASSLASGPWVKTSARTYENASTGLKHTVGSTRAAIGEVYGQNPLSLSETERLELLEYWRMSSAYESSRHKRLIWASEKFAEKHNYGATPVYKVLSGIVGHANPGQWGMTAGGTSAAAGKHGYTLYSPAGEYHIFPFTTQYGRHAGYMLKFANTQGKTTGGLWHELGTFRSPGKAKGAARKHEKSLLKSAANPKRKGRGYGRDRKNVTLKSIAAAERKWERLFVDGRRKWMAQIGESGPDALKTVGPWAGLPERVRTKLINSYPVKNPKSKRNLDEIEQAVGLTERFRGYPTERITELGEPNTMRDDYAHLGWTEQLVFVPASFHEELDCEEISDAYNKEYQRTGDSKKAWKEVEEEFAIPLMVYDVEGDEIRLAASADGKQLYFLGGKQAQFKEFLSDFDTDTSKDRVSLGVLLCVTYSAQKVQAGDEEERGYYHVFGEEGGYPPGAYFDLLNSRIMLFGGTYHLNEAERGIIN